MAFFTRLARGDDLEVLGVGADFAAGVVEQRSPFRGARRPGAGGTRGRTRSGSSPPGSRAACSGTCAQASGYATAPPDLVHGVGGSPSPPSLSPGIMARTDTGSAFHIAAVGVQPGGRRCRALHRWPASRPPRCRGTALPPPQQPSRRGGCRQTADRRADRLISARLGRLPRLAPAPNSRTPLVKLRVSSAPPQTVRAVLFHRPVQVARPLNYAASALDTSPSYSRTIAAKVVAPHAAALLEAVVGRRLSP